MAVLKSCIRRNKVNKNGYCNVQISISHLRKVAYIPLDIKVKPEHFVGGIIVKEPNAVVNNASIAKYLDIYQERLAKIARPDVYTATQLKELIIVQASDNKYITLKTWCDVVCAKLEEQGHEKNAYAIRRSVRWFCQWRKGDVIMADITPAMLRNYREWLPTATKEVIVRTKIGETEWGTPIYQKHKEKVKALNEGSYSSVLSGLRNLINRAIADRVVKYEDGNPTLRMDIPSCPVNDVSISVESMKKLISYIPTSDGRTVIKDITILSFYLGGINLVDMLSNKYDLNSDRFTYVRQKTKNTTRQKQVIEIPLFPRAKNIISKYINAEGYIDIHSYYNYKELDSLSGWINRRLKRIAIECDISERLCYNSMRKSFGQYALLRKVDLMVINYLLGHSSGSLPKGLNIMRYYAQAEFELAFDAMDRVFEYVDHPELYKDEIQRRMKEKLGF